MKHHSPLATHLDKLLKTAQLASKEPLPEGEPFGLTTRILADLRSDDRSVRVARWRQLYLTLGGLSCTVVITLQLLAHSVPTDPSLLPVPELNLTTSTK